VETFLGNLGNKGFGCMGNPCVRAAYILSNLIGFAKEVTEKKTFRMHI
jgi:hypothetical protein